MAIKNHLISPVSYRFIKGLYLLCLTHVHSFSLENDLFAFLRQAISSFTPQERNVIIQLDEIHVKLEISYKGWKVYGSNLIPEDPTRTVSAVMVSSLHKK